MHLSVEGCWSDWEKAISFEPSCIFRTNTTPAHSLTTTWITNQTKVTAPHTSTYKADNAQTRETNSIQQQQIYHTHQDTQESNTSSHQTKHKTHSHPNSHYLPQQLRTNKSLFLTQSAESCCNVIELSNNKIYKVDASNHTTPLFYLCNIQ